jgi:hypothetical protein
VTNAVGETWDDPSEDLLFMMLEEMDQENSFLLVERLDVATPGEAFMRITRSARAMFNIESHEASDAAVSRARIRGIHVVHEIVTRWALRLPGWEAGAVAPLPPERTPTRALFITGVIDGYIGPHGNDAIIPALRRLDRLNDQTPLVGPDELNVALWFCVPGPLGTFDPRARFSPQ